MKEELIKKLKRRATDYGINPDGRESQLIEAFEFKKNKKLSEDDKIEKACQFVSGIIGFYDINKRIEILEKEVFKKK